MKHKQNPYIIRIPEPDREDGMDAAIIELVDLARDYVDRWQRRRAKYRHRPVSTNESDEMLSNCLLELVKVANVWAAGEGGIGPRLQLAWHRACLRIVRPRARHTPTETELNANLLNHADAPEPRLPEPRNRQEQVLLDAVRDELNGTAPPGSWAGLTEAQRVRQRVSNHFGRRELPQKDVRRIAGRLLGYETI